MRLNKTWRNAVSDLGAISSYALAMQNVQMSLLKNTVEAQQQAAEILLNPDNSRIVSASETLGTNIDISV
jgi:hypothetical protein